jgi:uncharacterized membrane protein
VGHRVTDDAAERDAEGSTDADPPRGNSSSFRRLFFRGLGILLPSVLTLWLIVIAYSFVSERVAGPINLGVQELIIRTTGWPAASEDDLAWAYNQDELAAVRSQWDQAVEERRELAASRGDTYSVGQQRRDLQQWRSELPQVVRLARRHALQDRWNRISIGNFALLDLIGLLLAVMLIYAAGVLVSSFIGRRLYARGERLIDRVPLIRRVYPSVKQVTDFFVGDDSKRVNFNRVVAVEYPRKGLWSVGLVTGDTMQMIQDQAGVECLTIFVPSSPTPFTGYVITAPKAETIDLPITIEEALKFAVSGGVLIPPNQVIDPAAGRGVHSPDTPRLDLQPPPGAAAGATSPSPAGTAGTTANDSIDTSKQTSLPQAPLAEA